MKIEEVPQDKGYLVPGRITDLSYAVDSDGNYASTKSRGWKPKNDAMDLAWSLVYEKAEEARKEVLSGKLSPLAFYMELNIMDVNLLAGYTGLSRWKIKRHLKMKNFRKLPPDLLSQYATILNITTEDLVNIDVIREMKLEHED
jgi:hypothetical protein